MENYAVANGMNEPGYELISNAREAIRNGQFYDAMGILNELKRNKQQAARTEILKMLCGYKVASTSELLISNSKSVMKLQKIAEDSDWKTVREEPASGFREYVNAIVEYCAIAIAISPDTDRVRNARPSQRPSVFAQMDAEDEHNMERMRTTGETDQCQDTTAIENLVADYERHYDNYNQSHGSYPSYHFAHPDDQISKTINRDMSDLLITKDGGIRSDGFTNKLFDGKKKEESADASSFAGASEELLNRDNKPQSDLEKALHEIRFQGRNEAELKVRQVDLIKRIDQLEQQIFAV